MISMLHHNSSPRSMDNLSTQPTSLLALIFMKMRMVMIILLNTKHRALVKIKEFQPSIVELLIFIGAMFHNFHSIESCSFEIKLFLPFVRSGKKTFFRSFRFRIGFLPHFLYRWDHSYTDFLIFLQMGIIVMGVCRSCGHYRLSAD